MGAITNAGWTVSDPLLLPRLLICFRLCGKQIIVLSIPLKSPGCRTRNGLRWIHLLTRIFVQQKAK